MGRKKSKQRIKEAKSQEEILLETDLSSWSPPWTELPRDLTENILQRLRVEDVLVSAQKVCTTWREVCRDPSMWQYICMKNYHGTLYDVNMMCRLAVDRSQGQLLGIHLEDFGNDEMLLYIAQRSSLLKRFFLAARHHSYSTISGEGLIEAVKELPQLEELHIINTVSILPQEVETIGLSCPMLKSFTFNNFWGNDIALAIAKNMPNLHHLRLFGNYMTNDGLQDILDSCPHLESLDLRRCYRLVLRGDLRNRCFQQIKDLRLPSDSVDDYEWSVGPVLDWDYPHWDYGYSDNWDYDNSDWDYDFPELDYETWRFP